MFNNLVDVFFYDKISKKINYYENILINYVFTNELFSNKEYIYY